MDKKKLWIVWYVLFLICALAGLIPDPQGFWRFLSILLSLVFFLPGFGLLKPAHDRQDQATIGKIRTICIVSLAATTALIILNYLSALMDPVWGYIFYYILVVVSTPMICGRYWIISLLGWALLLSTASALRKK